MSLNRTMSSAYIQSDLKRQKIVDTNVATETDGAAVDVPVVTVTDEVMDSKVPQTPMKVIKKVNKKKASAEVGDVNMMNEINVSDCGCMCGDSV